MDALICAVPNCIRCFVAQGFLDAEIPAQLQMRPVVKRVSDAGGHHGGISLKFFIPARVSSDVLFLNTIGTHRTPFIVITAKP